MKYFLSFIFLTSLMVSCTESSKSVFEVEQEELTRQESGDLKVYVDVLGEPIRFTGKLKLIEGQCNVLFQTPVNDTVFIKDTVFSLDQELLPDSVYIIDSIYVKEEIYKRDTVFLQTYRAPKTIDFDDTFDRILGEWLFSYEFLPENNSTISATYKFTFQYNN